MLDDFHPVMTFVSDCARRLSPGYDLSGWLCKTTFTRIWLSGWLRKTTITRMWPLRLTVQDNFYPDMTFAVDCARQLSTGYDLCGWLCKTTSTRIWPLRLTVQDDFHPDMTFANDYALALFRYDLCDWLRLIDGAWYIFRLTFHEIMCAFGTSF